MSLIVTTSLSQSKDGTNIPLSDITGTGDTGYSALQVPVGLREITDILGSILYIYKPKSTTVDGRVDIDSVQAQAMANQTDTYLITNADINMGSSADTLLDGVYTTIYIPMFNTNSVSPNTIGVTLGSSIINCLDSNTAQFEGASHIIINYGTVNEQVVEIASISGTEITITTAYAGSTAVITGGNYYIGYSSIGYIAARVLVNSCLYKKTAQLAISNCSCRENKVEELSLNRAVYYGIQANMDFLKYNNAQKIIDYLTRYCTSDNCSC